MCPTDSCVMEQHTCSTHTRDHTSQISTVDKSIVMLSGRAHRNLPERHEFYRPLVVAADAIATLLLAIEDRNPSCKQCVGFVCIGVIES